MNRDQVFKVVIFIATIVSFVYLVIVAIENLNYNGETNKEGYGEIYIYLIDKGDTVKVYNKKEDDIIIPFDKMYTVSCVGGWVMRKMPIVTKDWREFTLFYDIIYTVDWETFIQAYHPKEYTDEYVSNFINSRVLIAGKIAAKAYTMDVIEQNDSIFRNALSESIVKNLNAIEGINVREVDVYFDGTLGSRRYLMKYNTY